MSAPLRIKKAPTRARREEVAPPTNQDGFKEYLNRLVKMIPSEVVGLYMIGSGYLTPTDKLGLTIWSAICFTLVIIVRVWGTSDAKNKVPPEIPAVIISAGAFLVWLYWLGGPFKAYHIQYPNYASLAVLAYTFVIPIFYKDSYNG